MTFLGVAAGRTEPFGLLDGSCTLLELGIVACCAIAVRPRRLALAA